MRCCFRRKGDSLKMVVTAGPVLQASLLLQVWLLLLSSVMHALCVWFAWFLFSGMRVFTHLYSLSSSDVIRMESVGLQELSFHMGCYEKGRANPAGLSVYCMVLTHSFFISGFGGCYWLCNFKCKGEIFWDHGAHV